MYVNDGKIFFNPRLLRVEEFLKASKVFSYYDINNEVEKIQLEEGSLAFTYCQIPIIYKLSEKEGLNIHFSEGSILELNERNLDAPTSKMVFERTGEIKQIVVTLKK